MHFGPKQFIALALLIVFTGLGIFLVGSWLQDRSQKQAQTQSTISKLSDDDVKIIVAKLKEKQTELDMNSILDKIITEVKELPNEKLWAFVAIIVAITCGMVIATYYVAKFAVELVRELARMFTNFATGIVQYSPTYHINANGADAQQVFDNLLREMQSLKTELLRNRR